MGLRDEIQTAVSEAMAEDLLDVVVEFNLVKVTQGDYDPSTDSYPETENKYETKGIFSSFGSMEIDGLNIKSEDEKVIVNGSDLSIAPEVDDIVELGNGSKYLVLKPNPVMGGGSDPIIYKMQVRRNK